MNVNATNYHKTRKVEDEDTMKISLIYSIVHDIRKKRKMIINDLTEITEENGS